MFEEDDRRNNHVFSPSFLSLFPLYLFFHFSRFLYIFFLSHHLVSPRLFLFYYFLSRLFLCIFFLSLTLSLVSLSLYFPVYLLFHLANSIFSLYFRLLCRYFISLSLFLKCPLYLSCLTIFSIFLSLLLLLPAVFRSYFSYYLFFFFFFLVVLYRFLGFLFLDFVFI